MSKNSDDANAKPKAKATATTTTALPPTNDKRTIFMLYDGSYESAFSAVKLARDTAKGDPDEGHDYNLVILEPKLNEGDTKTFDQVQALVKQENPNVQVKSISADLGDLSNPNRDQLLAGLETALGEALKAGLKSTVLKVTWTTDRVNSNKDVYQYILMVKGPILVNKLESGLTENQDALKKAKETGVGVPLPRTVGIDWANFGKLDEDIEKSKAGLGLHELFKKVVING